MFCPDYLCHSLIDSYLADTVVGPLITRQINLFVLGLFQEYKNERMNIADTDFRVRLAYNPTLPAFSDVGFQLSYQLRWNSSTTDLTPTVGDNSDQVLCRTDLGGCDDNSVGYLLTPLLREDLPKSIAKAIVFEKQYSDPKKPSQSKPGTYYLLSETNESNTQMAIGTLSVGDHTTISHDRLIINGIPTSPPSRTWDKKDQVGNYFTVNFMGVPPGQDWSSSPKYPHKYYLEFNKPYSCPPEHAGNACFILNWFIDTHK